MTLTPERWQRARDVLHEAMQMKAEDRSAFLDSQCATDPSLRAELKELLAAEGEIGSSFLEEPAVALVHTDTETSRTVLPSGASLGPYIVQSLIGAGGMGEVYRARDAELQRDVAIKVLPASLSHDPDRLRRFQLEAQAAAALNHANILSVFHIGQQDGSPYIVTELLEGETLRERLQQGALKLDDAIEIAIQIAKGLAAAHEKGVAHRDLKPENLFLTRDSQVKILDFGLAKLVQNPAALARPTASSPQDQTDAGRVLGTVGYMAPEQVRGQTSDARSDIFSLGCVLYEMLTGERAFRKQTSAQTMSAILNEEPPPASQVNRGIPLSLQSVVNRCLMKAPEQRYRRATEVRTALVEAQRNVAQRAASKRRKRVAVATLAILLLAVSVVGIQWWRRPLAQLAFRNYQMSALTSTGNVAFADISPDGKYLAYADDETGEQSLWVKQLATSTTVRVLGPVSSYLGRGVRFTPGGNYLYYSQIERDGSKLNLYRVAVRGGTPEKILTNVWTNDSTYSGAVDFSPDGKQFVFARLGDKENYLLTANADGSGEKRLLTLPAKEQMRTFAWAPDGQTIAFGIDEAGSGSMNCIAVISSQGGKERRVLRSVQEAFEIAWLPDVSGLVVSGMHSGTKNKSIWIVPYPEGSSRRVNNDLANYLGVSLDHGARHLATIQKQIDSSLWVAPALNPSQATPLREGAGRTDGIRGVAWLPDGRLVYGSGEGQSELWLSGRDGGQRSQLTHANGEAVGPSATPARNTIIFAVRPAGIWTIGIDGGNLKRIAGGSADSWNPEISPDGKWITYASLAGTWKMSLSDGAPEMLDPYGTYPTISPDGRWIAFEQWKEKKIKILASDGNAKPRFLPFISEPQVPESTNMASLPIRWTADGSAITYVRTHNGVSNLWSQPIDGGPARQLTNFTSMYIWRHAWSPDGKYLVMARGNFSRDAVMLTDLR